MRFLRSYIRFVDEVNYRIGRIAMYGLFAMMAILLWSIISKAAFSPSLWTLEAAQFAMVAYFFFGGPYAIQMGSNVRMDLLYENWSLKKKAAVDAITVFCLITYLVVLLWGAWASFSYSIEYGERSRSIWHPYLWPIKLALVVATILMIAQAVSEFFKDILRLSGETPPGRNPGDQHDDPASRTVGEETGR